MPIFSNDYFVQFSHLHFPIRNGAEKIQMQIILDGYIEREFEVELALDGPRQWWSYYDVRAYRGKTITLKSINDNLSSSQIELLGLIITQSDGLLYTQDLYQERYRPQLRFTPRRGWNNDPNGLVVQHGVWHMFYQWNPFGITWGNIHWGHAISNDLIHWTEQPVSLFQKTLQDMPWSGGGVIDEQNLSGFGIAAEEPMVLSFTSTGRGECLAYSLDEGRSFQEYKGNPIIVHPGRDPKIIWYSPQKKWIMIVYDESETEPGYALYDSADLKHWRRMELLPGWWECPEIFNLPVENGEKDQRLWVIHGGYGQEVRSAFCIGNFDGEKFSPIYDVQNAHAGPNFYAAQIFNQAPGDRCIMVGWLRDANYPDMPFGNGMSIPLELSLRQVGGEIRLCFFPIKEFEQLRIASYRSGSSNLDEVNEMLSESNIELLDIELEFTNLSQEAVILDIRGYPIVYSPSLNQLSFAGKTVQGIPGSKSHHLRIVVDRSVTEIFVDHGWGAFASMTIFQNLQPLHLEGNVKIDSFEVHQLKSIWV